MAISVLHHELGSLKFKPISRQSRPFKDYERGLQKNRPAELRPHNALALADTQLRQKDDLIGQLMVRLIQQQHVLSKLLAWQQDASKRLAGLTRRQRQIVELVLAGCPNKNIADSLCISQRTVENHRASIMKKTGSKSLPALVRLGFAASWNSDDQTPILTEARLSDNPHSAG